MQHENIPAGTTVLRYDMPGAEAFSANVPDSGHPPFAVTLPQHQAHGTRAAFILRGCPAESLLGVDAVVTDIAGCRIGVKTADCVPVLVHDPTVPCVAAIHSGWRGTLADIVGLTIEAMQQRLGCRPEAMHAVVGPCIHVEAYEVGPELQRLFAEAGYPSFCRRMAMPGVAGTPRQWHLDLPGICHAQLQRAGVRHIEVRPECTFATFPAFYSARRLGPLFDRQRIVNCIALT